ncbi:glycoside hydrolase family 97 protein [Aureibaculum sp. 2210JD6-5]|uniref:glycoside hydrolase family 97 protein n=1 Tax=Aureibaculum sp. 2210JD6-5 TaxID=3103957 RepID=UPI002AAE37B8|nr:glycoside hydrolase family 97 protein [Aureibaculum sp. 2210JD6-5]MDY7396899.1 glycoside hydrolase family 97 protein [Aureibaculum sp. 2210JD6-5]
MKKIELLSVLTVLVLTLPLISCTSLKFERTIILKSPDTKIAVYFDNSDSKISYSVLYGGKPVIEKSAMGFVFKQMQTLDSNLFIKNYKISEVDQTWEQPWGQKKKVRDNYHSLVIELQEKNESKRKLNIEFRVFNDGLGFRYIFPEQKNIDSIYIMDELTEFSFVNNHQAWNIPAYDKRNYEILYKKSPINTLGFVHTPLTIETTNELFLSIHEASLTDYSSMTLYNNKTNTLKCDLTPWKDGIKVKTNHSFKTPWRTIQIAPKPGDLIESNLILNLNEPNKLGDVPWVKPMKYVGIWWGIHINKWSFHQGPKLGATTENTIEYIDFAAKEGFDEVLVEGWNEGFEAEWYKDFGPRQDFTKPNPRFNIFKVQAYAKSKGVTLQAYNETCSNPENYLSQIDSAFSLYEKLGYRSVKVGQVNVGTDKSIFINGELHYGQYGVNYYQTVLKKAAKHQLSINFHEPVRPTGLHRTYPNLVSQEGARGQEYNAWSPDGGNPPDHLTILPFTRLLGGPMDFTPGIFRVDIPQMPNNRVNTTLSKQLALYVVIYSPIQMAADLIENYEEHPALQFIKDVPTNWEETKVIDAEIGEYIITARKDIDSEDWYLGAITDEEQRSFKVDLTFLDEGSYEAQIYSDSKGTNLETSPMEYQILKKKVKNTDTLELLLANSGGAAVRFKKMNE